MTVRAAALDNVQLAMPPDREVDAEAFYCGRLRSATQARSARLSGRALVRLR